MIAPLALDDVGLVLGATEALAGLTFALEPGEVLAIAGPSGSGKTSLLRVVAGLVAPSHGTIQIGGKEASVAGRVVVPPERRGLGMVFQDLALWPHLSAAENVAFALESSGRSRADARALASEALERVGLAGLETRQPARLSGGEQQRVALARALATDPALVLFDEPFSGLDVVLHAEMTALVAEVLAERGAAALFVTHDAREVRQLATRVAVIEAGRLVQIGALDEIARAPASRFAEALARRG